MTNKVYAFVGNVVRLTQDDYNRMHQSFAGDLTDEGFYSAVNSIDDWMHEKGIGKAKWFFLLTHMLKQNQDKRKAGH